MNDYNFFAQYQQNPQPPSGIIVKREWLTYYRADEKPERFDQILQSWDTANRDSELANFSVCTTWGIKDRSLFLLDVFRRKLEFPDLKRAIIERARFYRANVVLIEDMASGTALLQELRADNFSFAQPSPKLDGDKVMRLRAQTAKLENGTVRFPNDAPWLDAYLRELLGFPNARNDDQVDSTVFALAWITEHPEPGILTVYKQGAAQVATNKPTKIPVRIPGDVTHYYSITGKAYLIPPDRIVELSQEEPSSSGRCAESVSTNLRSAATTFELLDAPFGAVRLCPGFTVSSVYLKELALPDENWVRFGICNQNAVSDADNLFGSLTLFLMPLS